MSTISDMPGVERLKVVVSEASLLDWKAEVMRVPFQRLVTVIWLRVRVPVLSVARRVLRATSAFPFTGEKRKEATHNAPNVSTPCKSFTSTFCAAILFAAIDNKSVTTLGNPSGTNATRMETAKVTVAPAWPL